MNMIGLFARWRRRLLCPHHIRSLAWKNGKRWYGCMVCGKRLERMTPPTPDVAAAPVAAMWPSNVVFTRQALADMIAYSDNEDDRKRAVRQVAALSDDQVFKLFEAVALKPGR